MYRSDNDTLIILIVHVDDILTILLFIQRIQEVYTLLNNKVSLKNLREVETFLGIKIRRNRKERTITLY